MKSMKNQTIKPTNNFFLDRYFAKADRRKLYIDKRLHSSVLSNVVFLVAIFLYLPLSRDETLLRSLVVSLAVINAATSLFFYLKIKLDVDNQIHELEEKLNEVLGGKN